MNRTDTTMQLIWLRSDLRLHDNTALAAAAARGPTRGGVPVEPGAMAGA